MEAGDVSSVSQNSATVRVKSVQVNEACNDELRRGDVAQLPSEPLQNFHRRQGLGTMD